MSKAGDNENGQKVIKNHFRRTHAAVAHVVSTMEVHSSDIFCAPSLRAHIAKSAQPRSMSTNGRTNDKCTLQHTFSPLSTRRQQVTALNYEAKRRAAPRSIAVQSCRRRPLRAAETDPSQGLRERDI